jgi:hypothetical protein
MNQDISVDQNGRVWIIGCNQKPKGFGIWRLDGGSWTEVGGGASRIAVSPGEYGIRNGTPWVVNTDGDIYRWNGTTWEPKLGACATDIAVDQNDAAWITTCTPNPNGYQIQHWMNNSWTYVPETISDNLANIAVEPNGIVWVATSNS